SLSAAFFHLSCYCHCVPPYLHSFPTRRSSDLTSTISSSCSTCCTACATTATPWWLSNTISMSLKLQTGWLTSVPREATAAGRFSPQAHPRTSPPAPNRIQDGFSSRFSRTQHNPAVLPSDQHAKRDLQRAKNENCVGKFYRGVTRRT